MYGGEQQEQDENAGAHETGPDSEDSKTAISELCLLEPDNKLWVPMTITGASGLQTILSVGRLMLLDLLFCPENASASMTAASLICVPCGC